MTRRRRSARTSQIQRAIRRSRTRQFFAWLGPRWLSIANALALFALGLILLTSAQFRVEQVIVLRESASSQAAITRATQLSQVVGHNIFLLNTTWVAQEIAAIPSVRSARVVPKLPNIVEIEIVERVPIATWKTATAAFYVDDQGYIIGEVEAEAPAATAGDRPDAKPDGKPEGRPESNADARAEAKPEAKADIAPGAKSATKLEADAKPDPARLVIRDTTGRELRPGDQVHQKTLLASRELVKHLPAFGASVRQIEYAPSGLVLVTDSDWRVILGDAESLNQKLASFAAIVELARAEKLSIGVVDLRPKDRPFYQLAS
ncbi:MAG: FtsQ-type POTRA domain-containing protein [Chloroflexi bacterium]|nr:FtsQ-type POTRA domain-containing protein [Chloroflexota bacterium]